MTGVKQNQIDSTDPRVLDVQTSDPTTGAGKGSWYLKDVSGTVELFYKDSADNVLQMTSAGSLVAPALAGISDVILTAPANGQVLTFNGTNWVNQAGGGGGGSIVDDAYNESTWNGDTTQGASRNAIRDKFESIVEADGSVGSHSDVDLSGININDFLQWNGSNFVPVALAGGGDMLSTNNLSDVANASTSLSNLGGLAAASNLSDVNNAATSLSNLGGLSSSHQASVGDHTDVDLTGISDGQIMKWVNANSRFEPANESGGGGSISDGAYPTGWDGDTTQGASRNAIFDKIDSMDTEIAKQVGTEYKIQLGAGATVDDKATNAPAGGIPAGWNIVDGADGLVDAQLSGAIDDLVMIHGLGQVAVAFSVTAAATFGGWDSKFPSGSDTFAPGDLKTEDNNEDQTIIKNFNTAVGNNASFIYVKFFPILV